MGWSNATSEASRILVDPSYSELVSLRNNDNDKKSKRGSTDGEGPTRIADISRSRVPNDASRTANFGGPDEPDPFAYVRLR